jgi:DNA mismatch repair ATPase MutS
MKAFLMHRDQDLNLEAPVPPNAAALIQDLELDTLFEAMARGDKFLFDVVKKTVLLSLSDPEAIAYRQEILRDCLEHAATVREIYEVAVKAIEGQRRIWGYWKSPSSVLYRGVEAVELFVASLNTLSEIAKEHGGQFRSEGFVRFFAMLTQELNDEYLRAVREHLDRLKFRDGILMSAELGKGNRGVDYVLRRPLNERRSWMKRIFRKEISTYSFEIEGRDESGHQALRELRDRGLNLVANALAQSTDHILSFFEMLRNELGFYVGCLNLHEQLVRNGEPTCLPVSLPSDSISFSAQGLYDVCLTLRTETRVIRNDLAADNKMLVMITGANEGGKSTFLRSLGLSYMMMQCGMFVPAERFSASICSGIFTHYKREEDATMKSGKLDEELGRMSMIANQIKPGCILLCNESMSSTNEREGSEIAGQVTRALLEARIRVFYVTHLFELAQSLCRKGMGNALFLRAERRVDGQRTFRIVEGEPLPTSYGQDLYKEIFVMESQPSAAPSHIESREQLDEITQ